MKYLILERVWSLCSFPSTSRHSLASYGKLIFSNQWKIHSLCSLCSYPFPLTIININNEKSMERSLVFLSGRVDSHSQAEFLDLYGCIYFRKLIFITQTHNTGGRGINTSAHDFVSFPNSINLKISCSHSVYLFLGGWRSKLSCMFSFLIVFSFEMEPMGFLFFFNFFVSYVGRC